MKKIIFSLSLLLFGVGSIAQNEGFIYDGGLTIKTTSDFYNLQGSDVRNSAAFLKENEIEGSPYLNDNFILGYIITKDDIKYVDIPLRYNIYNNEIEFEKQEAIFALEDPLNYTEIVIGRQTFIFSSYTSKKDTKRVNNSSYFEALNTNKELLLLKRYEVLFNKPVPSKGYVDAKPAEFKKSTVRYYLKFGGAAAQEVGSLKATLLFFGDKSKDVATFVKKEKIKFRKEDDLLKIVAFYNHM